MIDRLAIDTNAYSALDSGNAEVSKIVNGSLSLGLPIIVLGEVYFGIEKGTKKELNLKNLQKILALDRLEILQLDSGTARIFGEISTELACAGKPIQQNDIWIAALCKQYGYLLLSADKGFKHIAGLDVISF